MVEDNRARVEVIRSWLPDDVHLVWAQSAGVAIGILERDGQDVYAGLLLDHDLYMRPRSEDDRFQSGTNVVDVAMESLDRDTAILVHSMNPSAAVDMVKRLDAAGFVVTRIPMAELTGGDFLDWLAEVREAWEA